MPPLLSSRPPAIQILLANVVPLCFGALCGWMLGVSEGAYLGLNLLAAIGGFGAGFEHRGGGEGAARGFLGGIQFGAGILLVHELTGAEPKADLPHPAIVLAVLTGVFGALLGLAGGAYRARRMRQAGAPPIPPATS